MRVRAEHFLGRDAGQAQLLEELAHEQALLARSFRERLPGPAE